MDVAANPRLAAGDLGEALAQPASAQTNQGPWRGPQPSARAAFARLGADGGRSGRQGERRSQACFDASALGLAGLVHGVARALAMEQAAGLRTRGRPDDLPRFAAAFHRALGHVLPDASSVNCPPVML